MQTVPTTAPSPVRARTPRILLLLGVAYTGFGVACGLTDTPLLPSWAGLGGADGHLVAVLGLLSAAVGARAAASGVTGQRLRSVAWVLCAVAGLAAWSLLIDLVMLLLGQAPDSWAALAHHLFAAGCAWLLAATARLGRQPVSDGSRPAPGVAPARMNVVALVGTVAFLPYAVMKLIWAAGGAFAGVSGSQVREVSERNGASGVWLTLDSWGLDPTALLAGLGVFLLWGLVRPWGQVFPRWTLGLRGRDVPRWLPLAPALIGAGTLAPYGVVSCGYLALARAGVVTLSPGDFDTAEQTAVVGWIGAGAFAVYGSCLAIAAASYWRRTRPMSSAASCSGDPEITSRSSVPESSTCQPTKLQQELSTSTSARSRRTDSSLRM